MNDEKYMQIALDLAKQGIGSVNPNPLVGAVIVQDGNIIGSGYHEKYGQPHAERNALHNCTASPIGSTMYVTLEPCCHHGKTPPCTDAIIESGIKRVVVATLDPNAKVSGNGIKLLQDAGIDVTIGILEQDCIAINKIFFHYIRTNTPYVLMKYAMTLDGKISTSAGLSKWITNDKSRHNVHQTRNHYLAIMVGVGTVIADNPDLTCRLDGGRNPIRVICDSNLRTPVDSKIMASASNIQTIIATTNIETSTHKPYLDRGVEIIVTPRQDDKVDLRALMKILGNKGIDSILLEGGGKLNFAALDSEIVNKIHCYIAPKIFGGETATSPVMGRGFADVDNKIKLRTTMISHFNEDICIESEVCYVHRNN
ncbi:bifunctional diaminohydroxyphosphoribosylaminopyrimidine deaminase/5-amino-6-(5-phosphoribosylamino)uracil reductase RibD [Candidatus Epulonipiscium viviparus]|uniref:bifunctional diaminohydroxyphosphoribosylaminopyrimidine deaminase/5-amino-6-(5-phosphoribosylamino)uracil reductase RibD n=1 Tax=Candidatus Epulonipiscium viviparus TaxID=420336 RepID=UPI00273811BD|nr:bifunctional diaminohydroxyphosphoribosylaminopyrimidine deaminase/5-amino-6-(5-phosphoribosylamino)uracil reductase RibD [Candidatus Epulopiscium viviparus]